MPIGKPVNRNSLSEAEKKKLIIALMEKRARGQELPKIVSETYKDKWGVDSRGYFPKSDGKIFNPYEQQDEFVRDLQSYFVLFAGSRGSGKSSGGAQKALRKILMGESGAVMNPTLENFKFSTWPELKNWMPWSMVVPSQRYRANPEWEVYKPFTMVFLNGAKMYCKGLLDPSGARGPNINWLWLDEGQEDDTGLAWQIAIPSARIGNNPQAWVTGTPRGTLHWMYKFFVEEDIPEEAKIAFKEIAENRKLVSFYHGTIIDNKDNLDPAFYASMIAAYPSGYLRQQELEGLFVEAEGALGDPTWFTGKILQSPPLIVKARLRYYDMAATEEKLKGSKKLNDPDEMVGTLLSMDNENFYIEDQNGGFWDWAKIKENIILTAKLDGPTVPIYFEQEPGSGGKNQVAALKEEIQKELPGYSVFGYKPEGDRVTLANHWFAEAATGKFYMVSGVWNRGFLAQLGAFPNSNVHDDKITSVSGARMCIAPIKKWSSPKFMKI